MSVEIDFLVQELTLRDELIAEISQYLKEHKQQLIDRGFSENSTTVSSVQVLINKTEKE